MILFFWELGVGGSGVPDGACETSEAIEGVSGGFSEGGLGSFCFKDFVCSGVAGLLGTLELTSWDDFDAFLLT